MREGRLPTLCFSASPQRGVSPGPSLLGHSQNPTMRLFCALLLLALIACRVTSAAAAKPEWEPGDNPRLLFGGAPLLETVPHPSYAVTAWRVEDGALAWKCVRRHRYLRHPQRPCTPRGPHLFCGRPDPGRRCGRAGPPLHLRRKRVLCRAPRRAEQSVAGGLPAVAGPGRGLAALSGGAEPNLPALNLSARGSRGHSHPGLCGWEAGGGLPLHQASSARRSCGGDVQQQPLPL